MLKTIQAALVVGLVAGCAGTRWSKPAGREEQSPTPSLADDPYSAMAAIQDDAVHDNAVRSWSRRLHEQGKDKEALAVANRIRNDQVRGATLTELQLYNLRFIGNTP
ncbi:hypothetical protein [Limnoglobus roseus]|uniref:Uncharacterized protein n=1 Tax=Limnoglobus roseus TaxID=2598579 RepID=A0A5C1AM51_9BACT|nr:hypothetical protein [Limnoglobus roseus]QEL18254.1 hypothetical protein PX52LOC_05270 [Limnoglobus roseus]